MGRILVVAVNTDETVRALKGEGRPRFNLHDRLTVLSALRCVDFLIPFPEPDPGPLIRDLSPIVYVKGPDYAGKLESAPEADALREVGCRVAIVGQRSGPGALEPKESSRDLLRYL